ncbi:MAG TPA: cysteine dioxygenase family protein [Solirubrobacteraceae bacterium]|nr:cysteine dioxygenase family protein [Solirubrobacteraceae bacterium]
MNLSSLPARDLDRDELAALVDRLAGEPDRWSALVDYDDEERVYASLHRDDHVDVWLLCWTPVNDTGWHDHDTSSGAVRVVRGALAESNPRIGGEPTTRIVQAGETFSFGPDHIHRLTGVDERSVSIHAYSPPLWRLGQYSIDADGVMRRRSVSYAEELRPLEPAA